MAVSERVCRLREQSLNTRPTLSAERALQMTEFYAQGPRNLSIPVQRALAFRHLMEHKTICINPGELIVGEKGPSPQAAPTFPELCCHTLEDLGILDSRSKISFRVDEGTRRAYEERIIPFWRGNSIRDRIFSQMTAEWKAAYESGVFTEFMEQRAPGHTVLDGKIYHKGFNDLKHDIQVSLDGLDYLNDPEAYAKQEELKAMNIAADALIRFAERHAEKAGELAAQESDPHRRSELEHIRRVCLHVPASAPGDFWEALQYYWFVHLGVTIELNTWDAFSPGRLDQHLYPFYKQGIEEGTLSPEESKELLQCLWIKFNNQPAPPKVGVTAEESGTYTDFAQVNLGGLRPDGADGVNDLTYLLLDVIEEMRVLQPSASVQLSKKSPDRFLRRAAKIIRTGFGQPSIFNCDLIVEELVRQGKTIEDARQGGSSGCVEVGAFGKENYNLTGYFNMPKVFEVTLNNGVDPRTGHRIGLETGDPARFASFQDLFKAYRMQLDHFIKIKVRGNNVIERIYAEYMPTPYLSLLIDDCIARGRDYHAGGARYNTTYIQGVGVGTLTDAMTAVKYHVFDHGTFTMAQLLAALREDFDRQETIRQALLNKTPKFGNDDEYADSVMKELFEAYFEAVDGRKNTKGGRYAVNLLPTTVHVYFGSVLGASADGRHAGEALSEGISPVQGADRHGPTAVIKSVAKMDQARTGGTLLNQKLTPQLLADDAGLEKLAHLVRAYFKLDGHHIQFNVVDKATLRAAQQDPEKHRDLIVRVAGYSDYFCNLGETLQNEIISRTEHESF